MAVLEVLVNTYFDVFIAASVLTLNGITRILMIIIIYALLLLDDDDDDADAAADDDAAAAGSKQIERFPWEGTVSASTLTTMPLHWRRRRRRTPR